MYSTKHGEKRIGACEEGMAMKRYRVKLSAEERQELKTLVSPGRAAAYQQTHGSVLLQSDEAHAGRGH